MTPKEKAEELVAKYYELAISAPYEDSEDGYCVAETYMLMRSAKHCALIAVDEILNALSYKVSTNFEELKYYAEVKQEIEKL